MNDDKHTCEIYHFDLYGTREYKYEYLNSHDLHSVEWQQLQPQEPQFFFVPKDFGVQQEYELGFKIEELMKVNSKGVVTGRDSLTLGISPQEVTSIVNEFMNLSVENARERFQLGQDSRDWQILLAQNELKQKNRNIIKYQYRPFDVRYTDYSENSRGFLSMPRGNVMRHFYSKNVALIAARQCVDEWRFIFVSENISDFNLISTAAKFGSGNVFPLYLYPESGSIDTSRRPNLDERIWTQINTAIGKEATPEDIFDYIYGILHSPAYRAKYKEFLKVDFPRIPYPKDQSEFEHFRSFGNQLRELHLMHNVPESPVTFPESGSMSVEKVEFSLSGAPRVYINATQYFANVPRDAWEFYIGGYQPAQKWLKDRKGRTLSFDDIEHYRKIISVLMETKSLMDKIG